MAKRKSEDDQVRIKTFFDHEIVNQYILAIQVQFGVPGDQLWEDVARTLVISGTTKWRRILKVGRHGTQVLGRPEPRLIDILRYIAATGSNVTLPRGRDVVLRSLAVT